MKFFAPAIIALAALMGAPEAAQEPSLPPFFPEEYLTARAPAEFGLAAPLPLNPPKSSAVEKPQSIDGSTYTVVTPIFTGQNSNFSYIRFPNADAVTQITRVTVVGTTTGTVYGTATVTIRSGASLQYSVTDILNAAGVATASNGTALTIGNESVSLYLRNSSQLAAFQHVIYNSASGFFENMSNCTWLNGSNYHPLNQGVVNIHTTAIPGYPSYVTIHNLLGFSVGMALDVYNSANGQFLGTYTGTAVANGTYAIPMANIQSAIGWSPGANDYHVNLVVRSTTTSGFFAIAGQFIYNSSLSTYINMSQVCPINYG